MLIIVTIMGVVLARAGEVWQTARQREREQELLFVGEQFRRAIGRYHDAGGNARRYPTSLEDLLRDDRFPTPRRHLRRIFPDPMTDRADWALVKGPGGQIVGVHSRSDRQPLKRAGFAPADRRFEGASKYSEWVFFHSPGRRSPGPGGSGAIREPDPGHERR